MDTKEDIKPYEILYKKIADLLIGENVSPNTALIILHAMSESMYNVLLNDPHKFNNSDLKSVMF